MVFGAEKIVGSVNVNTCYVGCTTHKHMSLCVLELQITNMVPLLSSALITQLVIPPTLYWASRVKMCLY